jgi:hypothetical protein
VYNIIQNFFNFGKFLENIVRNSTISPDINKNSEKAHETKIIVKYRRVDFSHVFIPKYLIDEKNLLKKIIIVFSTF